MSELECDICQNNNNVKVRASSVGPVSFAYCERCLAKGYEPYNAIVNYYAMANMFYEDFTGQKKEFIDNNLDFHNKSKETFNQDIRQSIKKFNQHISQTVEK